MCTFTRISVNDFFFFIVFVLQIFLDDQLRQACINSTSQNPHFKLFQINKDSAKPMNDSESVEIKNDESQIEEEQPESRNQGGKRARKKAETKKKKIIRKQEQRRPIDGKQQFGDKSICRLCRIKTEQVGTVICNRCHFKYHKECILAQDKEPQVKEGEKWRCCTCIVREENKRQKELEPKKKRKEALPIHDYFKTTKPLPEDKQKKQQEFQQKFPMYMNGNKVEFPILDEYLTAYQGLFSIELKRKPAPKEDTSINQEYFEDILRIWDCYNNMDKIVSDILYTAEPEQQSQLQNIGTLIHFKDNHRLYSQKSRQEIFEIIKEKPRDLILFFGFFYLKQIIEDLDIEQMQKQQYKIPYWHLMGYLWFSNRPRYYQLLKSNVMNLPHLISRQGILKIKDTQHDDKLKANLKLILSMVDGLEDLKKTPLFYQFRTENLLSNNRMKQQMGLQIKTIRSQICEKEKEMKDSEAEHQQHKEALITNGLSRQESAKVTRQMEAALKRAQKLKQEIAKFEREHTSLSERYNQLEQDLQIVSVAPLLLNPSIFLGLDFKHCQYYFFLYEPDKIFVCYKDTLLDEDKDMKWGYYDIEDAKLLLTTLCDKGIRERNLIRNIQELQKSNLLTSQQIIQTHIDEEMLEHQANGDEEAAQNQHPLSFLLKDLMSDFGTIEASLTTYLSNKNSRWCSSETRNNFRKSLASNDMQSLCKAIEYFVENTMMQEKLELRLEEENEEKNADNDDDSSQHQNNNTNNHRKRKIVEDDSFEEQPIQQQSYLQQLEQMDVNKVRVRKLPMKLFGTYYENLRLNLLEQLRNECDLGKLRIALEVLGQIVRDYIDRKKNQQALQTIERPKKYEEIPKKEDKQPIIEKQYLRTRTKNNKPQYIEIESKWDDVCHSCGQGGKVICCDSCPRVFHPKCLQLKEVPQGKWNCLLCLSNFERQVKTRATIRKLENQ